MATEELVERDGRPTVRVERRFPHPIDDVWRAVTAPEHLSTWFPSPVALDLRVGGAMTFTAFDGDPDGAAGRIDALRPPNLLSFSWGDDHLTFELVPDGTGTRFVLTHSFDDRPGAASYATGWELCLAGLRQMLAGEEPPAPDRGIARHEELTRTFGLDQPEVSDGQGAWTVRIERQLTCPAEVAWDLWFGLDQTTGEQRRAPGVGGVLTPYMAPDVVIGQITEVAEPHVLAFDVAPTGGPGDCVRLELRPGTGHGARIVLTVTGSDPGERDEAAAMWATGAVGHLAASAAEWALGTEAPAVVRRVE